MLNLAPDFNIFANKTIHEYIIIIKNAHHIKHIVTHIHVKREIDEKYFKFKDSFQYIFIDRRGQMHSVVGIY